MRSLLLFLFILSLPCFSMVFPERDAKGRPVKRIAGVNSDKDTRVRFVGTHDFSIAGSGSGQQDWTVPQLQHGGVDKTSIFKGVQYKVVGGCDGDKVKYQVVHPTAGVLDEFATDFYIFKDSSNSIGEYRAELPAGLYIRVIYQSTCANSARFIGNIFRYMETD